MLCTHLAFLSRISASLWTYSPNAFYMEIQTRDLKQGVLILKVHERRMFELSAEDVFHQTISCCWLRSFPSLRHKAFTSFSCSKWASKTHHLKQRFTLVNAVTNIFTCSKEYCGTHLAWFKLSMVNRWTGGLIS